MHYYSYLCKSIIEESASCIIITTNNYYLLFVKLNKYCIHGGGCIQRPQPLPYPSYSHQLRTVVQTIEPTIMFRSGCNVYALNVAAIHRAERQILERDAIAEPCNRLNSITHCWKAPTPQFQHCPATDCELRQDQNWHCNELLFSISLYLKCNQPLDLCSF